MTVEFQTPWLLLAWPLALLVGPRRPTGLRHPSPTGGAAWPWRRVAWVGRATLLALLAAALAGPRLSRPAAIPGAEAPLAVLVVDASGSMAATDGGTASRLTLAKGLLSDFVDRRLAGRGWRVGVVAFAGRPRWVAPPSGDLTFVKTALAGLEPDRADVRTDLAGATALALEPFAAAGAPARGMVVLASDGAQQAAGLDGPIAVARAAAALGVPLHTLAVGPDDPTTRADRQRLATMATITGGVVDRPLPTPVPTTTAARETFDLRRHVLTAALACWAAGLVVAWRLGPTHPV